MHDKVSILETSNGRCYSIILTSEMTKKGIRRVEFGLESLSKIYIHNPGIFEYEADKKAMIKNSMGEKAQYRLEYDLLEMLNDKFEPCNEDPKYEKDNCIHNEIEKFLMKEFGCTPPHSENKENICTNETISKQVFEYWDSEKFVPRTSCPDPCKVMLFRVMPMASKIIKYSRVKLHFQSRVKVVKSYYAYSGLTVIAEIGGYIGLFLGVSINQIPHLILFIQELVQKYI